MNDQQQASAIDHPGERGIAAGVLERATRAAEGWILTSIPRQGMGGPSSALGSLAAAPTTCSSHLVESLVSTFIRAFNSGNADTLNTLITSPSDGFQWYSTWGPDSRVRPAADDRSTLLAYLRQRHDRREQLTLKSFAYNGRNGVYGNYQMTLTRQSSDEPVTPYAGKGAVVCVLPKPTIAVWSIGPATQN